MNTFSPSIEIIAEPGTVDRLSESVLDSLARPLSKRLYAGLAVTTALTVVTIGVWPLFKLRSWLRDFSAMRQARFLQLAEWYRLNVQEAEADRLSQSAERVKVDPLLARGLRLLTVAAVAVLFTDLGLHRLNLGNLYRTAFGGRPTSATLTFSALLCLAALGQMGMLIIHHGQLRRFIGSLNRVLAAQHLPAVASGGVLGFPVVWFLVGVMLSARGGFWPWPILFAAGMQRSYIRRSAATHAQIGLRVRELLQRRRPALRLPAASDLTGACPRATCGAPLPLDAKFCPRCGQASQLQWQTRNVVST